MRTRPYAHTHACTHARLRARTYARTVMRSCACDPHAIHMRSTCETRGVYARVYTRFGSISASPTACPLRGYGRTPAQWPCRRRCRYSTDSHAVVHMRSTCETRGVYARVYEHEDRHVLRRMRRHMCIDVYTRCLWACVYACVWTSVWA